MKRTIAITLLLSVFLSLCSCGTQYATETTKIDKKNTLMIAHRGLSGMEVENTESAFIAAGEHSYYGIEADVRKTADGDFVICHDDNLKRVSGKNISVESSTMEELLAAELIGKDGQVEHLTTLLNYINICKQYDKQAILELKSEFTRDEIAMIISLITAMDYIDRVTFISFSYDNLKYVREILPSQSAMYLFKKLDKKVTEMLIRDKIDVAISYKALTEEALREFKAAGLKVNCWTVDDVKAAERLAAMGVDYITSNILE